MSDIKIIKVSSGGAKVDSSGFFIKPKPSEPSQPSQLSQLSQFIEQEKKSYEDDDDKESVDSMSVSDVSSATNQSHEDSEYTAESMKQSPLLQPQYQSQFPKVNSIVKDETLNSYLEKPKVELPKLEGETNIMSAQQLQAPTNTQPQINQQPIITTNSQAQAQAQPVNNRNDYYSDAEEDVIDMTDNKLYDILSSVLEDEDGENVSENMAKMNRNLEKVITMFEAYQQNNTKDEYLSKLGDAIENQNKILSQLVSILEKQAPNNESTKKESTKKESNEKNEKHDESESSTESSNNNNLTDENTDDTEKNPNIKKVKISNSIKQFKDSSLPLKHRIQIKRKT